MNFEILNLMYMDFKNFVTVAISNLYSRIRRRVLVRLTSGDRLIPAFLANGPKRMMLILIMLSLAAISVTSFSQTNYYSKPAGNLELIATWGDNPDGTGIAPSNFTDNDQVFNIRNNASPTIGNSWTVSGTNSKIIIGDGTNPCTLTIPGVLILTGTADIANNGTLRITSTAATPYSGTLTVNDGGAYEHAVNGGTIPAATWGVNSNLNISLSASSIINGFAQTFGNINYTGGTFTLTMGQSPTLQGNLTINSGTLADGGNTITVYGNVVSNGTHSGAGELYLTGGSIAHAISGGTNAFGNIEIDDANGASFTGTGTTTVNGNLAVTLGTLTVNAFTTGLTVAGSTSVGTGLSSAEINLNSTTGTRIFTGLVTIGSNGTWNNSGNAPVTFRGGITNNGIFSAGTGIQTFNTNAQQLTGVFSIPSITVTGITFTNNNSLTVNTALAGSGGLTQAANASLNVGFGGAVGITTLNASANGNTVTCNFAGAQTIKVPSTSYYNLILTNSGAKNLAGSTTVDGNILVSGTTAFSLNGFTLTTNGDITVNNGTTLTVNSNAILKIAGGNTITNSGICSFTGATALTPATITRNGSGTFTFLQNAGSSTFTASFFKFEYCNLIISNGAVGAMSNGSFSYGTGFNEYINFDAFPVNINSSLLVFNPGPTYNIRKTSGAGIITISGASGTLSGEAFDEDDSDPGTLINWTTGTTFYSQGTNTFNTLPNWNTNPLGGGSNPVAPDLTSGLCTFIIQDGHTVTLATPQNIDVFDLIVGTGTSGVLTIGSSANARTITVRNDLTVANGGTVNVGAFDIAHILNINKDLNINGTFDLYTAPLQVCNLTFTGAGAPDHTISGTPTFIQLNNLTLASGSNVTTAEYPLDIQGSVTISATSTFNGGGFTHTVLGNWTGNATGEHTSNDRIIFGGAAQTINGPASFYNIEFAGTGTKTLGTGVITVNNDLSITAINLTVTSNQIINVAGKYLITGNSATITPTAGLNIAGNLEAYGTPTNIGGGANTTTIGGNLLVTNNSVFTIGNALGIKTISVTGNVQVDAGSTLSAGLSNTHALSIAENLIADGDFNMVQAFPGSVCNVTFTGGGDNTITGTGTTCNFNQITVNKTLTGNFIDVQRIITMSSPTVAGSLLTLTRGTFKLSSASTLYPYFGAVTVIPAAGALWLNNSGATVGDVLNSGQTGTILGTLQLDAGTFRWGGTVASLIETNSATSTINITGADAVMNINGGLYLRGGVKFTMTDGNIVLDPQSGANYNPVNNIFLIAANASNNISITGGTITIPDPHAGVAGAGNAISITTTTGTYNLTGCTFSLGDGVSTSAGSPDGFDIILGSTFPVGNLIINNTAINAATRFVKLMGNSSVGGNLTITNAGGSNFRLNNFSLNLSGNLVNEGTFTSSGGLGSILNLNGTSQQVISGSGIFTDGIPGRILILTVNNSSGATPGVDLQCPLTMGTTLSVLNLTNGSLNTSGAGSLTLGIGAASILTINRTGGSLLLTPVWNLAGVTLNVNYNAASAAVTTGNELPPTASGNIATLNINNANGVLLNSPDITVATSLTLSNGIFNLQNNLINIRGAIARTSGTLSTGTGASINFGTNAAALAIPVNTFTVNPAEFANLTINRAGGVSLPAGQNITLNGILTLTIGVLTTGANTLSFHTNDTPITRTVGTITTAAGSSLVFGTAGNTGGAAFSLPASLFTAAPSITSLTVNRDNKLTWNNQPLTLSGPLTLTNGEFDLNGQTFITTAAIPFTRTAGTFTPGAAATITFNNIATPFTIPDGLFTTSPVSFTNLNLNRGASILMTLGDQEINVTGTTTFTAGTGGIIEIKNADLQIAAVGGTPSANTMVVTNGTGFLKHYFATAPPNAAFTFPVGDNSGTAEYSPALLTLTANTTADTIGIKVTDAKHPANAMADNYITRYWSFISPALTTYTYSTVFTYPTADVVGTEELNFKMQRYDNGSLAWTPDLASNTIPGANSTLTTSSITEVTGKLENNDFTSFSAPDTYYWSRNSTNWNGATAWVVTDTNVDPGAGGTPTAVAPTFSNNKGITIRNGHNITVNAPTYTADQLTIASGGTLTLGANNLTLYDGAGNDLTIASGGTLATTTGQILSNSAGVSIVINGTFTTADPDGFWVDATSSISTNNSPAVTIGAGSTINYSAAVAQKVDARTDYANLQISGASTKTAQGAITINGNLTIGAGAVFADNTNTLTARGNIVNNGTHSGAGRLYLSGGTAAHAISGGTSSFGNLELDDVNGATITGTGTTTISGNLSVTSGTLTSNAFTGGVVVSGTTTMGTGAAGGLIVNSGTGTRTFIGLVTIGNNGTWNNSSNATVTFRGGITNNGTFTAGTGVQTFNTNSQSLTGTFSIPSVTVTGAGIALTNNNSLTVNTALAGTGALTQAAGASLNLGFTGAVGITTLNADAAGNTVTYNFAGAQTVKTPSVAYHHLVIDGSGTKILAAAPTVNGNLTISAATLSVGAFVLQVKGDVINNGIHTGTGRISLTGGSAVHNMSGTGAFQNLELNDSNGALLGSNTLINGTLTLTSGLLTLGANDLTLNNMTAVGGSFSNTSMIETNSTGKFIRSFATATNAGFNTLVFPVGSGGFYNPFIMTGLVGVTPGARGLSIRAVPTNPMVFSNSIKKYWDIVPTNITTPPSTLSFQYDPGEVVGNPLLFQPYINPGTGWVLATGPSTGINPATSTGSTTITGQWTIGAGSTFYSYITGDWNAGSTWTFDPGGTTGPCGLIPGDNDKVIILSGRTVTLPSNVTTSSLDITINNGGFLDLQNYQFVNNLAALRGDGILKLASSSFPVAATNPFVTTDGGTTEYNHSGNMSPTQAVYYHLAVRTADTVKQVSDITLNGNLNIYQGTFSLNDNTDGRRLKLIINGDVTVENLSSWTVGTGDTRTNPDPMPSIMGSTGSFLNYYENNSHRVQVYGDFTNRGTVRFSNLNYPVYDKFATDGFATVYFNGLADKTLLCKGQTDFYNLVVDKGTDQTFKLTVRSEDYDNFRLFGANVSDGETTGSPANPGLKKALWIKNGTLVLQELVAIPSLSEGAEPGSYPSDFFIPGNGALILDGAGVIVLSTADNYTEVNAAYGTTIPDNGSCGVNTNSGYCGLAVLGKLQVINGYLSTRESAGLQYWSYASGQIILNNGKIDTKQFHNPQGGSTGLVSYAQSGGTMVVRGRFIHNFSYLNPADLRNAVISNSRADNGIDEVDVNKGAFSINSNAANGFTMTGGTLSIYDVCNVSPTSTALLIECPPGNVNVTGGTVQILPTAGAVALEDADYVINTTGALYNFTANHSGGNKVVRLSSRPLTALNNITLSSAGTLFNANSRDVTVGGNFSIASDALYTTGTNTTTFNGSANQTFTVDIIAPLSLNRLTVNKPAGIALNFAGSQKTVNITGDFRLDEATINDNGNTINILGNVYSSGVHSGTGKIVMNSNAVQVLDGDGTGIFQNLELNKPADGTVQVTVNNNLTVNGAFTFSGSAAGYKQLNLQTWTLNMSASASFAGANDNRYVLTSGNFGDGGIRKYYSATSTSFTFPVATVHTTVNSTPATISIGTAPTTWGSIQVVPVKAEHPNTTTKNISLKYYWKVRSTGFTGLAAGSVTHSYKYSQDDVMADEADYAPARYDQSLLSWTNDINPSVDETNNIIGDPWLTGTNNIDGDYTAGDINPTNPFGLSTIYYSRINGLLSGSGWWGNVTTWSTTAHDGAPAAGVPGINDIVIIGGKDSVYLNSNLTVANTDTRSCASLRIETGSALDIGFNPGCNFVTVVSHPSGNGNLRLTTSQTNGSFYQFPSGDYSDFNVNRGTTEFYTTNPLINTIFILPPSVASFGTVILSPLGESNLSLPNRADLIIYGDLICRGEDWRSWLAMSWFTPGYGAVIPKTVHVFGNLLVQGGSFLFANNGTNTQHIIIDGDVVVYPGAGMDLWGDTRNSIISVGGNFVNNSNNDRTYPVGGWAGSNVRLYVNATQKCDLEFFGSNNAFITNTGATPATGSEPNTRFGNVTVNKGSSQATTLTINVADTLITQTDNWLTLLNGTLRYMRNNPNRDFTVSTITPFTIPSTTGLYVDYPNNSNNKSIIIGGTDNAGDLILNGKLTLVSGNILIGPADSTNFNNDIEYSVGGSSEIEVRGGKLKVNGQIRRNPSNLAGVLKYTQTGGDVRIRGRNPNATNAKFEIVNSGSNFTMSDGTLTIVRGNGMNISPSSPFGDLYLRPDAGSVTGGTIILSQGSVAGAQNYYVDATIPLNNLTITGASAANYAYVRILSSPLTLNGNMLISSNSFLNPNNIDVTFNGNFTNSQGTTGYVCGSNLTTFSAISASPYAGAQTLTGATTFNNLTVKPDISLTLNNSINVNGDFSLTKGNLPTPGNLSCQANSVSVKGDVLNKATYTTATGAAGSGLILNGTSLQLISGDGAFARLELNNAAGARLENNITIREDLALTLGILDIKDFLMTLEASSNILGAPFGAVKMITSDGVFSNVGIKKFFNAYSGPATTFLYPLGTNGKYTPALLTYTKSDFLGFIRVNNIGSRHPSVLDTANSLNYYWEIQSSGITGFDGNMVLNYMESDVFGTESAYQAAKIVVPPGISWSVTPGVDPVSNKITFSYLGSNNISGHHTAGIISAFFTTVPEFTAISDGNWNNDAIWSQTGGDPYILPAGTGPNGFIVNINKTVTLNENNCIAYRITINDTLKVVSPYYGHNLGTVFGNGTLHLESGSFPAGVFTSFLSCAGNATVDYGGSGTYTIIADLYDNIPNLMFTGTGTRVLPNKNLTICNTLTIKGPIVDNSVYNKKLTIQGSMKRESGTFRSGNLPGAIVSFAGTAPQTIAGSLGDFTGVNSFYNLEINNPSGLRINDGGAVEVANNLLLTNGLINTSSSRKLTITNTSSNCIIPVNGSINSFVDGPLIKNISQHGDFTYPIGIYISGTGNILGNRLKISSTTTGPLLWSAEYLSPNLTADTLTPPLEGVSAMEFYRIGATPGSQAAVNINWNPSSDVNPVVTGGMSNIRIANFNSGSWKEVATIASGTPLIGTASTVSTVTFAGTDDYTLGSVTNLIPRAQFAPTGPVCGTSGIPVSFEAPVTIPTDYAITYTIGAAPPDTVIITAGDLPYTLPTPVPGAYKLTGFTYDNGTKTGVVDPTVVNVYATPTTANAGKDSTLCGISTITLYANTPAVGSGLWTVVSGPTGTLLPPTSPTAQFIGLNGNAYVLRWTITNGTCTSSNDVNINFTILPDPPVAAPIQNFCSPATVANLVAFPPSGCTVNWFAAPSGGTPLSSGTALVLPTYYAESNGGAGCISLTRTPVNVTVYPLPTPTIIGPNSVCLNSTGNLYTTETGKTNYGWSVVGGTITAGGNGTSNTATVTWISAGSRSVSVNYQDAGGCSAASPTIYPVTVHSLPTPTLSGPISVCAGSVGNVYQTELSMSNYVWTVSSGGSVTGGGTSTDNTVIVKWNTAGAELVTVNYTDANGCTAPSATPRVVNVNNQPVPSLSGPTPVCVGTTGNVYTTDAGRSNYVWTAGPGATITAGGTASDNTVTVTWTTSGPKTVTVNYTDASSCTAVTPTTFNVTVDPLPTVVITNPAAVCSPATADLTAAAVTAGSTPGLTWTYWTDVPGTIPLASPNAVAVSGTYYIKGTIPATGCFAIQPVTVTVNPTPTVVITNPAAVCSPATVDLTAAAVTAGSTPGLTWTYWTDALGTIALASPNAIAVSGTYYIKGMIPATGCYLIQPVIVTVNPTPTVVITDPAAVCSPATADLTAAAVTAGSTPGLTWTYWTDVPGTIPLASPNAVAVSGTYYIKGTVPASGCYSIQPVTVTLNLTPTVIITDPAAVCSPATVDLTAAAVTAGSTPGLTWTYWTDALGTIALASPNAVAVSGTYYIKGTIPPATGCYLIQPVIVTVNPTPTVVITNPATACSPATVDLTAAAVTAGSTPGLTWTYWMDALGTIALASPNAVAVSGTYYIKGTVPATSCFAIQPVMVTVNPMPMVVITNPAAVCSPTTVDLTAAAVTAGSTPGLTCTYWTDALGTIALASPNAVAVSGTYYIKGTIPATGCISIQPVTVAVNPSPSGSTIVTNVLCNGGSTGEIDLTPAGGTAPYTYLWNNSAATEDISGLAAGSYTVRVTDANACFTDLAADISEPDDLAIEETHVDATCPGETNGSITINITGGTQPYNIIWNDNLTSATRPASDTTYKVIVTDDNGCSAMLDVVVGFSDGSGCIQIPTVITPNGDGKNDTWLIKNIDIYPNAEVLVYNRWGKLIFRTRNIMANPWDGKFNGKLVPIDSYHYILYVNDGTEPRSGTISVIR